MTVLVIVLAVLSYTALGFLVWHTSLRIEVYFSKEDNIDHTFFGDEVGPVAIIFWPIVIVAATVIFIGYPFYKFYTYLYKKETVRIEKNYQPIPNYDRIVKRILLHKEILPMLIGIHKELDDLISREAKK